MNQTADLTCVFFSDILPWERESVQAVASQISVNNKVQFVDLPDKVKLTCNSPVVWVISKNWKEAIGAIQLTGKRQRLMASVLGLESDHGSLFTLLWRKLRPKTYSRVSLITHSPINFRFLSEIEGIESSRISYLPLPVMPPKETQSAEPKSGKVIGFFGAFRPEGNMNYFLNVAHYVLQRNPTAKFRLMGLGPLYDHALQMSKQLDMTDSVTVSETISSEDLKELDIQIYAPVRNDHFIPLFIGATLGIPVLSSELPGVNAYIQDGRNGFVVPANETKPMGELVLRLMENEALRKFIGLELKRFVAQNYSVEKVSAEYAKLFFDRNEQSTVSMTEAA